jgi:hypothetical protein
MELGHYSLPKARCIQSIPLNPTSSGSLLLLFIPILPEFHLSCTSNQYFVYYMFCFISSSFTWSSYLYNVKCTGKGRGDMPMQAQKEGVGKLQPIFNLTATSGWVVNTMPWRLYPWKRPSTHCTGGWVHVGASLVSTENLTPTRIWSPNCLACGKYQYWLYTLPATTWRVHTIKRIVQFSLRSKYSPKNPVLKHLWSSSQHNIRMYTKW